MSNHEISQARKNAIELAKSFGWDVKRNGRHWEFRQPDTGGLWDIFRISHGTLSVRSVLRKLAAYEPELGAAVAEAEYRAMSGWLKAQRPAQAGKWITPEDTQ